jgi:hypothetical protein
MHDLRKQQQSDDSALDEPKPVAKETESTGVKNEDLSCWRPKCVVTGDTPSGKPNLLWCTIPNEKPAGSQRWQRKSDGNMKNRSGIDADCVLACERHQDREGERAGSALNAPCAGKQSRQKKHEDRRCASSMRCGEIQPTAYGVKRIQPTAPCSLAGGTRPGKPKLE